MWKKVKALVEPLERFTTTLGAKGPKSNATHTGGTSQFTYSTKQQVSELQKQSTFGKIFASKPLEQTRLRNFLLENFSFFKAFSLQPVPTFSRTPLRIHKPQGFGVISQHAFIHPVGTRNAFCGGFRNFSTVQPAMLNNGTNTGGAVLAQLGFKPFSAFSNKSGSLWFQKQEVLDQKSDKVGDVKKQKVKKKKKEKGRKFTVLNNGGGGGGGGGNKGIFEIVKNSSVIEDKNRPRIIRRSSMKRSSEKNKVVENISEVLINDGESFQVYMSIILSSSIFWNLDNSTSMSDGTNSTRSVLSYLLQRSNHTISQVPNSQLNSSFVQNLREIAEMQHDHMMEVISILGALLRHGDFDVKINGCELRINFPRGMRKSEIENMLQSLGIDPDNPHFELEEFVFGGSIAISPPTDEGINMQLPEPNGSYFDNELVETSTTDLYYSPSPSYEVLSYLSSSDSPVLLPIRDSMDNISSFPSSCMSPVNSPPRLGVEYIVGIQEFLNAVDEALIKNVFNRREEIEEDDEIGEDYYEI